MRYLMPSRSTPPIVFLWQATAFADRQARLAEPPPCRDAAVRCLSSRQIQHEDMATVSERLQRDKGAQDTAAALYDATLVIDGILAADRQHGPESAPTEANVRSTHMLQGNASTWTWIMSSRDQSGSTWDGKEVWQLLGSQLVPGRRCREPGIGTRSRLCRATPTAHTLRLHLQ